MGPVSERFIGFMICCIPLVSSTLLEIQYTRVGVAHDAVRNASVASADCLRRVVCDEPQRFGGVARGVVSGAREEAIRQCGAYFLDGVEGGERGEILISPVHLREGDEATVNVRLAFPCTVPFANAISCDGNGEVSLSHTESVNVTGCDQRD